DTFQGGPTLEGEQPIVQLDRPVIDIPPPQATPIPEAALTAPGLSKATAEQLVQGWLTAKAAAMGKEHKADALTDILIDPMLKTWRGRSREALNQKLHWEYEHQVKLGEVKTTPDKPDSGQIAVEVREVAKLFKNGKADRAGSYDAQLRVRYEAVRKDGRWYLRNVKVLQ
ncbi:MAG TPA: ARC6/PARC6 family protein, partial [Coleofasciculaceae cyanobacterium]